MLFSIKGDRRVDKANVIHTEGQVIKGRNGTPSTPYNSASV